tara:strand:+ start:3435 stop:4184 length:750 start_codon:yes stop_codon:yes gene_type:complete
MKTCVIRQPAGLGDILHLFKVGVRLLETKKADVIYWPVYSGYNYISEYISHPNIIFVDKKEDYPFKQQLESSNPRQIINTDELLYIPFEITQECIVNKGPGFLYCKYDFVGLDYKDWYKYVTIKRNKEREKQLEEYINNNSPFDKDNFVLTNRFYGTTHQERREANVPKFDNEVTIVDYDFDRPFDWIGLAEKAKEIHTVDTCFCWIFRILGFDNLTLYGRGIGTNFDYCKGYCSPKWNFCETNFGHVD